MEDNEATLDGLLEDTKPPAFNKTQSVPTGSKMKNRLVASAEKAARRGTVTHAKPTKGRNQSGESRPGTGLSKRSGS